MSETTVDNAELEALLKDAFCIGYDSGSFAVWKNGDRLFRVHYEPNGRGVALTACSDDIVKRTTRPIPHDEIIAIPSDGKLTVHYGPRQGHWFKQGAIDNYVLPLAEGISSLLGGLTCRIWYDEQNDFYHLAFAAGGKQFDIRYYKAFSVTIDGKDGWVGCPRSQCVDFAHYIYKKVHE